MDEIPDEVKKTLLKMLRQIRHEQTGSPRRSWHPRMGICGNMTGIADHMTPPLDIDTLERVVRAMEDIWEDWPEFSGNPNYPIRVRDFEDYTPGLSNQDYYGSHRDVLWDRKHPYGAARWRLLEWVIDKLEKDLGEDGA